MNNKATSFSKIKSAEFKGSHAALDKLPAPDLPEFAFTGRSNVGKSTLINILTQRKNLAKTSNKPGKTQTINHILVNKQWYLVDLPGYGYAKTSKKKRTEWSAFTFEYILNRPNLMCVFVLADASIPPKEQDLEFIAELGGRSVPIAVIMTKTDKLSKNKINQNIQAFKKALLKDWEEVPPLFLSNLEGAGREEILAFIKQWYGEFK